MKLVLGEEGSVKEEQALQAPLPQALKPSGRACLPMALLKIPTMLYVPTPT